MSRGGWYPGVVLKWNTRSDSYRFVCAETVEGQVVLDAIDAARRVDHALAEQLLEDDQGDGVMTEGNEHLFMIYTGNPLQTFVHLPSERTQRLAPVFVHIHPLTKLVTRVVGRQTSSMEHHGETEIQTA